MKTLFVGLNRTFYSLVLLFAVIVLNFVLVHIAPGDAVTAMIGDMGGATPELVAKLRADYGLDQSLFTQLRTHIWKMIHGDFGISFTHRVPVRDLILDHLPATILLVTTAFFLALITGTILGIIAAQNPKRFVSHVVTVLSLSGFSAPIFWTGFDVVDRLRLSVAIVSSFWNEDTRISRYGPGSVC